MSKLIIVCMSKLKLNLRVLFTFAYVQDAAKTMESLRFIVDIENYPYPCVAFQLKRKDA